MQAQRAPGKHEAVKPFLCGGVLWWEVGTLTLLQQGGWGTKENNIARTAVRLPIIRIFSTWQLTQRSDSTGITRDLEGCVAVNNLNGIYRPLVRLGRQLRPNLTDMKSNEAVGVKWQQHPKGHHATLCPGGVCSSVATKDQTPSASHNIINNKPPPVG